MALLAEFQRWLKEHEDDAVIPVIEPAMAKARGQKRRLPDNVTTERSIREFDRSNRRVPLATESHK